MSSGSTLSDHDASGHLISPFYGYLPLDSANILFLTFFTLTTLLHLAQSIRYRTWWLLPTVVLAGCGEVLGWAARAWSHDKPLDSNPYLIQTVVLIISPTPLIGALFITFGRMSAMLGHQYSRISPRLYSRIFFTSDFVALFIQAVGGGIAASSQDVKTGRLGSNIMLAGIVFQLVSLSIFCALLVEYLKRRTQNRPLKKFVADDSSLNSASFKRQPLGKPMAHLAIGLCIAAALLYIRAIYRTVELADGWSGKVIQTQSLFIIFDGVMVFGTMLVLNICNPGRLLKTDVMVSAVSLASKLSQV
ncbi:RTA1 like protein-domain-containing protein [Trametes punicea]|nr:RTA1 like protein-domain-containing protein [Trametes punicea]